MRLGILALSLLALNASAQMCSSVEYAQYKDRASSDAGLLRMAVDYCSYHRLAKGELAFQRGMVGAGARPNMRESDACISAMSKMSDAAEAAGKTDQWRAMTATDQGCDEAFTKLTGKPRPR
jgi:hypothetical protein